MQTVGIQIQVKNELEKLIEAENRLQDFQETASDTGDAMKELSEKSETAFDKIKTKALDFFQKKQLPKIEIEGREEAKPAEEIQKPKISKKDEIILRGEEALKNIKEIDVSALPDKIKQLVNLLISTVESGSEELKDVKKAFEKVKTDPEKFSKEFFDKIVEMRSRFKEGSTYVAKIEKSLIDNLSKIDFSSLGKNAQESIKKLITDLKGVFSSADMMKIHAIENRVIKEQYARTEEDLLEDAKKIKRPPPKIPPPEKKPEDIQPSAGGGASIKSIASWIIGSGIAVTAINAIRTWSEADTQLIKIQQRLGGSREEIKRIGDGLGYTIAQSAELSKQYADINNQLNAKELKQIVGYSRVKGIEPEKALQIEYAQTRFLENKPAKEMLNAFEAFAEKSGMGKGRIEELIVSTSQLAKSAYSQRPGTTQAEILALQTQMAEFWKNAGDVRRGQGEMGVNFTERLNQGMQAGGDAQKAFALRAVGFGKDKNLWEAMEQIEKGVYDNQNLISYMNQLQKDAPGANKYTQMYLLQGFLGDQLKKFEIRALVEGFNTEKGKKILSGELPSSTPIPGVDFATKGKQAVSAGETFSTTVNKLAIEAIEPLGGALAEGSKKTAEMVSAGLNLVLNLDGGKKRKKFQKGLKGAVEIIKEIPRAMITGEVSAETTPILDRILPKPDESNRLTAEQKAEYPLAGTKKTVELWEGMKSFWDNFSLTDVFNKMVVGLQLSQASQDGLIKALDRNTEAINQSAITTTLPIKHPEHVQTFQEPYRESK